MHKNSNSAAFAWLMASNAVLLGGCWFGAVDAASTLGDLHSESPPRGHLTGFGSVAEDRLNEAHASTGELPVGSVGEPDHGQVKPTASEIASIVGADTTVAYRPPYPKRTNPFEFGAEVDYDVPQEQENQSTEVKLYGFVGDQDPKAIIHAGGRTRFMARGDRWGVIELLEIHPPEVRIRIDGVVRTWSLLGHNEVTKK